MKYHYLHNPGCGEPAFIYDHMPQAGEVIGSKHATHLDGRPAIPFTRCMCDSCGEPVYMLFCALKNLVPIQ